ncbi:uncharacterized protein LOC115426854 [Sphaeramia orbicularis]|uniref:uncharacterized protein LOC115426854 n=1 Tax=Sphaeramia orbicularis TaxID=375764 RepID=UPI00117D1503|nr:uncharacterized protein LOC115426854 [Sphaeramia orbicularis]
MWSVQQEYPLILLTAVSDWLVPQNVKELRSFLGLAPYYHRYILGFATFASPLHQLTQKGQVFKMSKGCVQIPSSRQPFSGLRCWHIPTSRGLPSLTLTPAKWTLEWFCPRRASRESRSLPTSATLSPSQRGSTVSPASHFRDPEGQLTPWLETLQEFDFEIHHRAGLLHVNADSLSRHPCEEDECQYSLHEEEWDALTMFPILLTEVLSRCGTLCPLISIQVGAPMEQVAVDVLGSFPTTDCSNRYVLVAMDYFTKWPEAYAIPDQSAMTTAKHLVSEMFCCFGPASAIGGSQEPIHVSVPPMPTASAFENLCG